MGVVDADGERVLGEAEEDAAAGAGADADALSTVETGTEADGGTTTVVTVV